jgi:hypothetical protein
MSITTILTIKSNHKKLTQNLWKVYKEKYNNIPFEISIDDGGILFKCGYTHGAFVIDNKLSVIAKQCNLYEKLTAYGKNIAIQCDFYLGLLHVHDIYDIDKQMYYNTESRLRAINKINEAFPQGNYINALYPAKIISIGQKLSNFNTLNDLLGYLDSKLPTGGDRKKIIFRSLEHIDGEIISFKLFSNKPKSITLKNIHKIS